MKIQALKAITAIASASFLCSTFAQAQSAPLHENIATVKTWPAEGMDKRQVFSFQGYVDIDGQPLTQQDVEGKYLAILGGYLECQHICSNTTQNFAKALIQLKQNYPDIAAQIVPVAILISNNKGDSLDDVLDRAALWQQISLRSDETGVRVFGSADQDDLDHFAKVFDNELTSQGSTKTHLAFIYLVKDGEVLNTILPGGRQSFAAGHINANTSGGSQGIYNALLQQIESPPLPTTTAMHLSR